MTEFSEFLNLNDPRLNTKLWTSSVKWGGMNGHYSALLHGRAVPQSHLHCDNIQKLCLRVWKAALTLTYMWSNCSFQELNFTWKVRCSQRFNMPLFMWTKGRSLRPLEWSILSLSKFDRFLLVHRRTVNGTWIEGLDVFNLIFSFLFCFCNFHEKIMKINQIKCKHTYILNCTKK